MCICFFAKIGRIRSAAKPAFTSFTYKSLIVPNANQFLRYYFVHDEFWLMNNVEANRPGGTAGQLSDLLGLTSLSVKLINELVSLFQFNSVN